jgi:hypothetical protein
MNLWARFKAWWEAGKADQQAINARRQHALAESALAGVSTLGAHDALTNGYHSPSGSDCGPTVSGDCGGTAV